MRAGSDAVILDGHGRVLLHRRSDDGLWGMPGGWIDPGETPEEAVVREALEETGLLVRPLRVAETTYRAGSVHHTFICEVVSGTLAMSAESLELAYRDPAEVEAWHIDHEVRLMQALRST